MSTLKIVCRSLDHRILEEFVVRLLKAMLDNDFTVGGPVPLPVERKQYCMLASPFVYKNTRVKVGLAQSRRLIILRPSKVSKPVINIIDSIDRDESIALDILN